LLPVEFLGVAVDDTELQLQVDLGGLTDHERTVQLIVLEPDHI